MGTVDRPTFSSSSRTSGKVSVIALLCVCVFVQMLGVPFTLLGLLNADVLNSDILTEAEPVSEDLTALSPSTGLERPGLFYAFADPRSVRHLPEAPISVFRPPII